jgi:hypothetical protein
LKIFLRKYLTNNDDAVFEVFTGGGVKFHVGCLQSEDGGSKVLRKFGILQQKYMATQPRRTRLENSYEVRNYIGEKYM